MRSGGQLDPHIHEQGWISGSLYLSIPPTIDNESGNLVLSIIETRTEPDRKAANVKMIKVPRTLCLFPHRYTTIRFHLKTNKTASFLRSMWYQFNNSAKYPRLMRPPLNWP